MNESQSDFSIPIARTDPYSLWDASRQLLVTEAIRNYGGRVDVALVGDSLTGNWRWDPTWTTLFGSRRLLNLGLGGDATSHLLWRLEQGLVDGLEIGHAVLLIGVNNCWEVPPADAVRRGIAACLARLRKGLPTARITLYGIFPVRSNAETLNPLIEEINGGLTEVASLHAAEFRDIGASFFQEGGGISPHLMPDGVHLSADGYSIWGRDLVDQLSVADTATNPTV